MGIENFKGITKHYDVNISNMSEFVNSLKESYRITVKKDIYNDKEDCYVSPVRIIDYISVKGKHRTFLHKETFRFKDKTTNEEKGNFIYMEQSESYYAMGGGAINDRGFNRVDYSNVYLESNVIRPNRDNKQRLRSYLLQIAEKE